MNVSVAPLKPLTRRRLAAAVMVVALIMQMLALVWSTGHLASWLQVRVSDPSIVCTAAGLMRVLPTGELERVAEAPDQVSADCPYCAIAMGPTVLPGASLCTSALPRSALGLAVRASSEAGPGLAPPHLLPPAQAPPVRT